MYPTGEARRDIVPPHVRQVTVTDSSEAGSPREAGDGSAGDPDRFAGGQDQVIVLPPPKDDDPTWRRPWRGPGGLPWWVIVPVVLLTAFGLYEAGQRGWLDPGGQAAQARSEASDMGRAAAERAAAARRFRQVADSLRGAVEGYDVRRSDFERNRIECASLAAGYRRVDRHFVSLAVLLRERGDLGSEARDRYEGLTGQVDEVNRHFDGTGCRTGE